MLISSCKKVHVATKEPVPPRDSICSDGRVGVADVGRIVHVIDRSGDVVRRGHG